jgi:hypothetical protein
MKPFLLILVCAFGLIGAGCTTTDPLARFYQPYQGAQQNWPVEPGCFITQTDGLMFFHGLPAVPYVIIGRFDRANLPPSKLAASARVHGANAVCLVEQQITGMQTDPGMILFGKGVAAQLPGNSHAVSSTIASAYLLCVEGITNSTKPVKTYQSTIRH